MANRSSPWAWSSTPASNTTADSDSTITEPMNAGLTNDRMRDTRAFVHRWLNDTVLGIETGGSGTAYTLTTEQSIDTLFDRFPVCIIPHANSGSNPTLAVNSIAAKDLKLGDGGAIAADYLVEGRRYVFEYVSAEDDYWLVGVLHAEMAADIAAAITAALGVNTDVWTGTTTKAVTGGALVAALASVSVTMDNAMELDLATGRNFKASATLNTNSTISIANEKTTVVTLTFTCDGSARTLTFPSGSVTVDGFSTLTKQFAASQTHQAICYIRESGVYDWTFRENIKAAA